MLDAVHAAAHLHRAETLEQCPATLTTVSAPASWFTAVLHDGPVFEGIDVHDYFCIRVVAEQTKDDPEAEAFITVLGSIVDFNQALVLP